MDPEDILRTAVEILKNKAETFLSELEATELEN